MLGLEVDGDLDGANLALRPPLCSPVLAAERQPAMAELAVAGVIRSPRNGARLRAGSSRSTPPALPAPCISSHPPPGVANRRRRDADNLGKAVLELLTAHQVH